MKKLLVFLKDYKKETVLAPLFKMLEAGFELFVPLVMAAVIDRGIAQADIPYVLKMADFSQAAGQDGKISADAVKNAINKVLEDVPALKPQAAGSTGFIQVGAGGSGQEQAGAVDAELDRIFGVKKK